MQFFYVSKYIEMNKARKIFVVLLVFIFLSGILFCLSPMTSQENMANILQEETLEEVIPEGSNDEGGCPDLLIRSGAVLHLLKTNKPKGPTNPLIFENLEKYTEYIQKQRENGIRCPVLFLQEENDAQGNNVYRMRPGPEMNEMNAAVPVQQLEVMDASKDRPPFNETTYSGFDAHGQHIGQYTELDKVHDSTQNIKISDNPMDANWGGILFSQASVDSGKYIDREVAKPRMIPKVMEIYK